MRTDDELKQENGVLKSKLASAATKIDRRQYEWLSEKHDALLISYYDLNEKWSQMVEPLRTESQATRQQIAELLSERSAAEAHREQSLSDEKDGAPQEPANSSRTRDDGTAPRAKASADITKKAKLLTVFRRKHRNGYSATAYGRQVDQEAAPPEKETWEKTYQELKGRYAILQQRDQKWKKLDQGWSIALDSQEALLHEIETKLDTRGNYSGVNSTVLEDIIRRYSESLKRMQMERLELMKTPASVFAV